MESTGNRKTSQRHTVMVMIGCILIAFAAPLFAESTMNGVEVDSLYRAGEFAASASACERILANQPRDFTATLGLGRVRLLENSLAEAEKYLRRAVDIDPVAELPKSALAECFYRQGKFAAAAALRRELGDTAKAQQLEYFTGKTPYLIESDLEITSVEFVITDPLPIVKVKVNDSEELNFLIDTGGGELIIGQTLADKVGAVVLGSATGVYAGGKKAETFLGAVDRVQIGDFVINNVPVNISPRVGAMSAAFGIQIDGIIGTVFLYHFIATLDYPRGKLTLRLPTDSNIAWVRQELETAGNIVIPFWLAGDHFMVAWGTVNGAGPFLFFVDTGMAGGGFTGTDWLVAQAGIELPKESFEGTGGGGKVQAKPAMVSELTLGDAERDSVMGIFNIISDDLGDKLGFQLPGLISHGFFRAYKLTFDFATMNLVLSESVAD